MIHRAATSNGKKYHYYVCSGNKHGRSSCTTHTIRCDLVERVILAAVQAHVSMAIDMDDAMNRLEALDWERREVRNISGQLSALELDMEKISRVKLGLYEDLKEGLVTAEEYRFFREDYDSRIESVKRQISGLIRRRTAIEGGLTSAQGWFAQFRQYENIDKLTRNTIVSLIERIEINNNKDIHVKFRHADQFAAALEYLDMRKSPQRKVITMKEAGWNGKNIPQTANIAQSVSI